MKTCMKAVSFLMIVVMILTVIIGIEPADAEGAENTAKVVTVTTKKRLLKEIGKKGSGTIIFESDNVKKLTLKSKSATVKERANNKSLIIDAPNAKIKNCMKFKDVTVKNAKTWSERVSGNKITVLSNTIVFSIYKKMTVEELTIPSYTQIKLGKKAEIIKKECTETDTGKNTDTPFVGVKTSVKAKVNTEWIYTVWEDVPNVVQFKGPDGSFCFGIDGEKKVTIYKTKDGEILPDKVSLSKKHSIFGTVTCDENGNYFLVTGEENPTDNFYEETVFVSKYDSAGNHIKTIGYTGNFKEQNDFNTRIPFDAGNCAAVVMNGVIAVNYAREMYNGHQSNCVFALNINDLSPIDADSFYNSHSFAQRAIALNEINTFVFASHGDGFPRADRVNIMRMYKGQMTGYKDYELFHFWCAKDDSENNTYANIGGIVALSDNRVALVGESAASISEKALEENREIFIQIFNPLKNLYTPEGYYTEGTRSGVTGIGDDNRNYTDYGVKWLTSYGKGYFVSNVQVAATDDDRIVILYELFKTDRPTREGCDFYNSEYQGVYYMILDGEGNILNEAKLYDTKAKLNPYEMPVFAEGKIWWVENKYDEEDRYNEKNNALYLYGLDPGPAPEDLPVLKDNSVVKTSLPIDRESFPDEAFRNYVLKNLDLNGDGLLSRSEAGSVTVIDCHDLGIKNLSGIEYFYTLNELDCSHNEIESLDLRCFEYLNTVNCSENKITDFNVDGLAELEKIDCSNNNISALKIVSKPKLTDLNCSCNQIADMELKELKSLCCLDCNSNNLTVLDLTGLDGIRYLFCYKNRLDNLDVTCLPLLIELSCQENNISKFKIDQKDTLEILRCDLNKITELDVSGFKKLWWLECGGNSMTSLNVEGCQSMTWLFLEDNKVSKIDVSQFKNLTQLGVRENQLVELDVSNNPNLDWLGSYGNNIQYIDLSHNPKLNKENAWTGDETYVTYAS